MSESTNWKEKYNLLVDYIKREEHTMSTKAMMAFRHWQYDENGEGFDNFVQFECIRRELTCILGYADCILHEDDEE